MKQTQFTAEDVDRIVGIGDQFLVDWEESDAEQPESDRDSDLPQRTREWETVRPLLLAAPKLADLLERAINGYLSRDSNLAHDIRTILEELAPARSMSSTSLAGANVEITKQQWLVLLAEGFDSGAHWRPCIEVETPAAKGRDGFYFRDLHSDDKEEGPFPSFEGLLNHVLGQQVISASRLIQSCGFDRATASAILAITARVPPLPPTD